MARKSKKERMMDLDEKIKLMQLEKQRLANELKQKERKERTRRLIKLGAIMESQYEVTDNEEEAIKVLAYCKESVLKNKESIRNMDINVARKILGIEIDKGSN